MNKAVEEEKKSSMDENDERRSSLYRAIRLRPARNLGLHIERLFWTILEFHSGRRFVAEA